LEQNKEIIIIIIINVLSLPMKGKVDQRMNSFLMSDLAAQTLQMIRPAN
jgi:hypothetical protein